MDQKRDHKADTREHTAHNMVDPRGRQDPLLFGQTGNPGGVCGVVPGSVLCVGEPPLAVVAPVVDGERGGVVEEARVNLGVKKAVEVVAVDSA